jgi:uncharacterized protein (TIGR02246 family)
MINFCKASLLLLGFLNAAFALEKADQSAIQQAIQSYTDSWNLRGGKGFADAFAENADFVNIFGMKFSGKEEIENRHIKIIQTFFKDSKLEILDTQLREVQPGLVIATVYWRLNGFRTPDADTNKPGEARNGVYTQVFINSGSRWEITASQNTMMPSVK